MDGWVKSIDTDLSEKVFILSYYSNVAPSVLHADSPYGRDQIYSTGQHLEVCLILDSVC